MVKSRPDLSESEFAAAWKGGVENEVLAVTTPEFGRLLGDKDRAKYAAIGESDRMTLKFVKPVTAR